MNEVQDGSQAVLSSRGGCCARHPGMDTVRVRTLRLPLTGKNENVFVKRKVASCHQRHEVDLFFHGPSLCVGGLSGC